MHISLTLLSQRVPQWRDGVDGGKSSKASDFLQEEKTGPTSEKTSSSAESRASQKTKEKASVHSKQDYQGDILTSKMRVSGFTGDQLVETFRKGENVPNASEAELFKNIVQKQYLVTYFKRDK